MISSLLRYKSFNLVEKNMEHIGDNVVSFLKKATSKLEELQLQTALGKAELSEKLEDIKKDTKERIHYFKSDINSFIDERKEDFDHVKAKLEHLELQLALAKADTLDEIKEQKKNLSNAVRDLKYVLKRD